MDQSSSGKQQGIARSAAVITLGMVALAGSIASVLVQRILTPAKAESAGTQISKLVTDEWETDLTRLNLPTRSEVEALNRQLAELEAQVNQIIQQRSHPQEGN